VNRHAITLGRILGIPIGLDYSWFLIFVLITVTLATLYYPAEFQNWAESLYWIAGAVTAIMLFVSVLLHELGHAAVALRYKIPVRGITLFIFGGAAQIATEPPSAGAEFWIAIAGPIVSLALAILYRLMQPIFGADAPLSALVKYLAYINGTLALFNLIPGFPLDGGRVFRAIIWGVTHSLRRATLVAVRVGRFIAFLFIFVGAWQMLAGHLGNGLWIACVGWFLASAVTSQVQQQPIRDVLAGLLEADAPCVGQRISQIAWPRDCVIATLRRGQHVLIPHGDTVLKAGDVLVAVVEGEASVSLQRVCMAAKDAQQTALSRG